MTLEADGETITVTVRKVHVYVTLALLAGFGSGFWVATWLHTPAGSAEAAVAAAGAADSVGESPEDALGNTRLTAGEPSSLAGRGRPFEGRADAPVTVVEFTDYECTFCARHYRETYGPLLDEYGDRIRYVVRNFPGPRRAHAREAAEAAECALAQGRFFEYRDLLLQNTTALTVDDLMRYASRAGLRRDSFDRCLESGVKGGVVSADLEVGRARGVRATPTFFVNGRIIVGAQPLATFRTYIEEELRREEAGA